ncbi:MAG: acyl-CoA dehydratase activase, partial [Spirochaetota bacterium]
MLKEKYWVGIDVGSITVKIAVVDPVTNALLFSRYIRHNADQARSVFEVLSFTHDAFPEADFDVVVCGSGGLPIAKELNVPFIQEVVANSIAIRTFYKNVRVAIELGGQDAKVIFFNQDALTGQLIASDMRMNGSCAGGTGAFIDQVAELLNIKTEDFGQLADKGRIVYDISGRCGVFAKTDIQPLLNQGAAREDIALSSFHAIAKQTIGGLAQGLDIAPPVIFEGGPLTFNRRLVEVFKERLSLHAADIIIPDRPEIIVAHGAALSVGVMFSDKVNRYDKKNSLISLKDYIQFKRIQNASSTKLFFTNCEEKTDFYTRYPVKEFKRKMFPAGLRVKAYLGIDAGSTTTKFVLLDENSEVIYKYYSPNRGDPLRTIKYALLEMNETYKQAGVELDIQGAGTTGYGETLFSKALHADFHNVETVAHAEAAQRYVDDATFILDIGGQDMKALSLKGGIITGITLNEACSAGCGSFVETYARSLGIPVEEIASRAFKAQHPSRLGSRCTVFMNSSIITEQKNGQSTEDILAGICRSIIENVFTKIIRISNLDSLGNRIVVQGGTFKNDAVLRAFEQYLGKQVIRPPFPGEMGAIGIALLTRKFIKEKLKAGRYQSSFIGLEALKDFEYEKKPGLVCQFCSNNCTRTLVSFNDGTSYITGNRCERGEIVGDIHDPIVKNRLAE